MDRLSKAQILEALAALAQELERRGSSAQLLVVGGAAVVLLYGARDSTKDVDAISLRPSEQALVRSAAEAVAPALGLPEDWLNDGAKGYLHGIAPGEVLFAQPGLVVQAAAPAQLLAMKLTAWRDDLDIDDARLLLSQLQGERDEVWEQIEPFLVPGRELKAQYAFADLWETERGHP